VAKYLRKTKKISPYIQCYYYLVDVLYKIIEAVRLLVATPSLHCHNNSCYEIAEGFEQY
jgi:hypothetical protein